MKYIISKKNKIKIITVSVLYGLALLVLLCLLLEGLGTGFGKLLNMPAANGYVNKNYKDVDARLVSSRYEKVTREKLGVSSTYKTYIYEYEAVHAGNGHGNLRDGDRFIIEAYNFRVSRDTVFTEYNRDNALIGALDEWYLSELSSYCREKNLKFTPFAAYADVSCAVGEYDGSPEERARDFLKTGNLNRYDLVLHVEGEKVDFEAYKEVISKIAGYFTPEVHSDYENRMPANLQIFYYYSGENGERVTQYETELAKYELRFGEDGIRTGSGMHYKVEVSEEESRKIKAYNTVKQIYIWVLVVSVFLLTTYWVYTHLRKWIRMGNTLKD